MEDSGKRDRNVRFWRKFLRLTRGRVPVLRALEVISGEEKDAAFGHVVDSIRQSMEKGIPMSQAMREYPPDFSSSVVELVRMAEKTGAWDEILEEITGGLAEGTFD